MSADGWQPEASGLPDHWTNPAYPGWYAWRGGARFYARLRQSSPPMIASASALGDLGEAIDDASRERVRLRG